jgi:hypothetical protein
VVVRLLAVGQQPDDPVGIIGNPITVPANNVVRVTLPASMTNIKQISVHGGKKAWDIDLGTNNQNAHIASIRVDR